MQNALSQFFKPGGLLKQKTSLYSASGEHFSIDPPENLHSTFNLTYCKEQNVKQQQHPMDNTPGVLKIHTLKSGIEKFIFIQKSSQEQHRKVLVGYSLFANNTHC